MKIEVITPEKKIFEEENIKRVILPLTTGEKEILHSHVSYIAQLGDGIIEVERDDETKSYLTVFGGFVEVLNDNVKIVAFVSERKEDIDKMRALEAKERAEKRLKEVKDNIDIERAKKALKRAEIRLKILDLE